MNRRVGRRFESDWFPRLVSGALFLGMAGFFILWPLSPPAFEMWIHEGGIVETLSAAIWIVLAIACFTAGSRPRPGRVDWLFGGAVLFLFAARELDIQKRLTDWNVGHVPNYWDAQIPANERLIVIAFFVLPGCAIITVLVLRMWRRIWQAFRAKSAWSRDLVAWGAILVAAAVLDKFHKLTPALGLDLSPSTIPKALEESLELTFAVYVLLVLLPVWRRAISQKSH